MEKYLQIGIFGKYLLVLPSYDVYEKFYKYTMWNL